MRARLLDALVDCKRIFLCGKSKNALYFVEFQDLAVEPGALLKKLKRSLMKMKHTGNKPSEDYT